MQSSLWTPSLNTQTRIHFHTHILAEPGTDTQALQFCNNGPAHRCVCLFGSNHRNRSSSAQPKGQTEREAIRQTWARQENMMMHDDVGMREGLSPQLSLRVIFLQKGNAGTLFVAMSQGCIIILRVGCTCFCFWVLHHMMLWRAHTLQVVF